MTISARVVADSVSPAGKRLTTLQLRYPKFIHGELMTHRALSRNASSSRAIPVERLISDVIDDPVYPSFWGKNQAGMQAAEVCDARVKFVEETNDGVGGAMADFDLSRDEAWDLARDRAVVLAGAFADAGYHKQVVNRLLEPFCHINVVVTATEWANFFALRRHPAAQPEMRELADRIWEAREASAPQRLDPGQWHLPYVRDEEWSLWPQDLVEGGDGYSYDECAVNLVKLSVARCARVSYLTQDGKRPSVDEDLALYGRLVGAQPIHASPAEHQATPDVEKVGPPSLIAWMKEQLHGNFVGWVQYRKTLPGECVEG